MFLQEFLSSILPNKKNIFKVTDGTNIQKNLLKVLSKDNTMWNLMHLFVVTILQEKERWIPETNV